MHMRKKQLHVAALACITGFCSSCTEPKEQTAEKASNVIEEVITMPAPTQAEIRTTKSGLQYIVLKTADASAKKPTLGAPVTVHYTGWLYDSNAATNDFKGKKFDSSRDRNEPFKFPIGAGRVIKGWDEGVVDMKVGEIRRLIIPAELGYGARGAGPSIPGGATLIFDVELLGV
jgi:FKBP-type peptidyl-prolyl cis-trans isomerase